MPESSHAVPAVPTAPSSSDSPHSDPFRLDGRLALITGSSDGIGLALARALGRAGARVVLNGRDAGRLEKAASALLDEGGMSVDVVPFDVTDRTQVDGGVDRIEAGIGAIDILVNNAGIQRRASLEQFSASDWDAVVATNLSSVFHVSQSVARAMLTRGRGRIINIASVQSELARPGIAPYAATKGAIRMLTRGMAVDWGPRGLNVNGIAPGYFRTSMNEKLAADPEFSAWLIGRTPSRRWGNVEELGGAAVFLASDAASFVNGHLLYVDGGVTAQL